MNSSQILAWLSSHWTAVWPAVSAVLLMLLRSRTPEQWVALGETSPRLQGFIRMLRGAGLDPPKVVSGFIQWVTGRVPSRPSAPPASPSRTGQSGRATVGAVALLLAAGLCLTGLGALLSGCPRLPPVSGCTPRDYRCTESGRPEVCSSTQRWQPIGDEACSASGAVCVVDRTAHCAPMQVTADPADGGVQ